MRFWLREWLRVGAVIAIAGGLLWLLVEHDFSQLALVRSMLWALVVWTVCGLVWMGLQYFRWDEASRRTSTSASGRRAGTSPSG